MQSETYAARGRKINTLCVRLSIVKTKEVHETITPRSQFNPRTHTDLTRSPLGAAIPKLVAETWNENGRVPPTGISLRRTKSNSCFRTVHVGCVGSWIGTKYASTIRSPAKGPRADAKRIRPSQHQDKATSQHMGSTNQSFWRPQRT